MTLRPSLLLATLGLACLAGCASSSDAGTSDPDPADASTSQEAERQMGTVPSMSLLGDGTRGGILILSFRAEEAVALSDASACRIELGRGTVTAPLQAGPATQLEGDTVVTQATYRLDAGGYAALSKAGGGTRVTVTIAGAEHSYPWVRSDFLE